jgi:hypothetical protein
MKGKFVVASLFLAAFLIGFAYLTWQNRNLRNQVIILRKQIPNLLTNEIAPSFEATDLNGLKETIIFFNEGKKHLLFVLSNFCNPCEKNVVYWKKLYNQLKNDADVIGIVLSGRRQALALRDDLGANFSLYAPEGTDKFMNDYKISNLSQTMLIQGNARVEWIKTGDLNGDDFLKLKSLVLNKKGR